VPEYAFNFSLRVANLLIIYDLIHSIILMIGLSLASKIILLNDSDRLFIKTSHLG